MTLGFRVGAIALAGILLAGTALAAEGFGNYKTHSPPNAKPIAMGEPTGPQGESWESLAKLPDFSGQWNVIRPDDFGENIEVLPLRPAYVAKMKELLAIKARGAEVPSTTAQCIPTGMPMMMTSPHGFLEFLLTPKRVTIISEDGSLRRIFVDGSKPNPDPDITFVGHSVGHWENGTLLVDTLGMDRRNQMFYGFTGGGPMHIIERLAVTTPDTITIDTTTIDPVTFTEPWTRALPYKRVKNVYPDERLCIQNNRDVDSNTGTVSFSLEPPPDLQWKPAGSP